jgi:hypothetical protein
VTAKTKTRLPEPSINIFFAERLVVKLNWFKNGDMQCSLSEFSEVLFDSVTTCYYKILLPYDFVLKFQPAIL